MREHLHWRGTDWVCVSGDAWTRIGGLGSDFAVQTRQPALAQRRLDGSRVADDSLDDFSPPRADRRHSTATRTRVAVLAVIETRVRGPKQAAR